MTHNHKFVQTILKMKN